MSTLRPDASAAEIEEEIDFTQCLLNSLDPHASDYQIELERLDALMQTLMNRLNMAIGVTPRPDSTSSNTTPDSSTGTKRPANLSFEESQPKRHSPLPTIQNGMLTGSDHLERARKRQQAAEAALRRQQTDEALARSLSQQYPAAGPSSQRYQATMNSSGSLQRPIVKAEPLPLPRVQSSTSAAVVDLTGDSDEDRINQHRPTLPSINSWAPKPSSSGQYQRTNDLALQARSPYSPSHNYGLPQPASYGQPSGMTVYGSASGNFASRALPLSASQHPGAYSSSSMPGAWPSSSSSHTPSQIHAPIRPTAYPDHVRSVLIQAKNGINRLSSNMRDELGGLIFGSSGYPHDLDDDDSDEELSYVGSKQRYNPYATRMDLYRDRYAQLEHYNPEKTQEEIEALLQHIRPDEDLPDNLLVQTPSAMSIKLHKYQELGLTWLKKCESGTNKGGILADDMGLGKTIQMLSLIVDNKSEDPRKKTTLIVAPVALLRQWQQEIRDKIKKRNALSVFIYHGMSKKSDFRDLHHFDIVLTTYGSLAAEVRRAQMFELRKKSDPNAQPNKAEKCTLLDPDCHWYRVILDEAQCIKNKSTQTAKGAQMLKATYRFCMTGTPMMNNVGELYSLVKFLRIKPYDSLEKFKLDIERPLRGTSGDQGSKDRAMARLQALCKATMLRRTKKSEYRGKPILVLPERTTEVDHAIFDEDENALYGALENKTQVTFNKYLKAGTVGKSYSAILVLLLRLRQACCHPHLIKDFSIAAAADMSDDDLVELAKQLDEGAIARIRETDGNFECPVCMDATLNAAIFVSCGHFTCRDCYVKLADPENAVQRGEEGARCPYCRVTIDPKRITDYTSFKRVHWPEKLTEEEKAEFNIDQGEADDTESVEASETESEDEDNADETLGGFIVNDEDETESEAEEADVAEEVAEDSKKAGKKAKKAKKSKKSKKAKGKEPKTGLTLAELKKQANRNVKSRKRYLKRLREDYTDSAKIRKMMDLLRGILDKEDDVDEDDLNNIEPSKPEKVLIFSQWTSLLDLCEIEIDARGWGYRRYDGSMNAKMRGDAVDDFKDSKQDIRIMLVSLKAGNAGLNLNVANQVIILDPFWNPYIEEQAIDRAHRMGQERAVRVHRVLVENTVEDRILALQNNKRRLIEQALDEQKATQLGRLGVQQLAYLFGVTSNPDQPVN